MLLTLLFACADSSNGDASASSADRWLGAVDTYLQFGNPDAPAEAPWLIFRIEEDTWSVRDGEAWTTGAEVAVYDVDTTNGLIVGGERLLPDRPEEGASEDGVTVESIGLAEVYYGTFESALTVSVDSGDFSGTQIFAEDFGLISVTLNGETWELVYYE